MQYEFSSFGRQFLEPAVDLFVNSYKAEREQNPSLPERAVNGLEWILKSPEPLVENPGVAVLE